MSCNSNNNIGLHLRLKDSVLDLAQQAREYNIKFFQFFLTASVKDTRYIKINAQEREQFIQLRKDFFSELYIHSSYWINPAVGNIATLAISKKSLKKEIAIARQLSIRTIVLHPGSASGHIQTPEDPICKALGIQTIAKLLLDIAQKNPDIEILLENTTHANRSIGSNLNDFTTLREIFKNTPNINFCLDIAHAFAYGYDVSNIDEFIQTLDKTMGLNRIKLIHLNDNNETCGSKKDNHVLPGNGQIGINILRQYYYHPLFQHIPKILELPVTSPENTKNTLNLFL
ncbi:MAG: deoxyribonuclease IV [bacterium]